LIQMMNSYVSVEDRAPKIVSRDDAYLKSRELHASFSELDMALAVYFMEQVRGNAITPDPNLVDLFAKMSISIAMISRYLKIDDHVNPRINQILNN